MSDMAILPQLPQNAEQPELERPGLVGEIPADQGTVPSAATQAASPLRGAASSSSHNAVNQLLKSVVRQNRTLRFVEPWTVDRPGGTGQLVSLPGSTTTRINANQPPNTPQL